MLDAKAGTPRAPSEARTTWPPSNARSAQHRKERSRGYDLSFLCWADRALEGGHVVLASEGARGVPAFASSIQTAFREALRFAANLLEVRVRRVARVYPNNTDQPGQSIQDRPGDSVVTLPATDEVLFFLVGPGPLFADKVVHHRHVDRVAGRAEAAELPAVLDRPQQGVVVVGDGRAACRVVGAGDHDREYVSAARAGAAASACVRKPTRARRAHVALVPRDEDHRVPLPGARGHDLADPAAEERVASGDQLRRMRGAAGIARRAATVHVMTLIGTDPVVVGDFAASEVGLELMQVDDLGHPRRVALHVGVRDERVVLPYVKLVAAHGGRGVAAAERVRLHVGFPRFPP